MMGTYIFKLGRQLGPFHDSVIQYQLVQQVLSYDDLAWRPGLSGWVCLRDLYPDQAPPAEVTHDETQRLFNGKPVRRSC